MYGLVVDEIDWTGRVQALAHWQYAEARMGSGICWARLLHLPLCMKARCGSKLGKARQQHQPVGFGLADELDQARVEHQMAKGQ